MQIEKKDVKIEKKLGENRPAFKPIYCFLNIYCFTIVIGTHIFGGQTEQLTGGVTVVVSSQPLASKILIDLEPLLINPAKIGELGTL